MNKIVSLSLLVPLSICLACGGAVAGEEAKECHFGLYLEVSSSSIAEVSNIAMVGKIPSSCVQSLVNTPIGRLRVIIKLDGLYFIPSAFTLGRLPLQIPESERHMTTTYVSSTELERSLRLPIEEETLRYDSESFTMYGITVGQVPTQGDVILSIID